LGDIKTNNTQSGSQLLLNNEHYYYIKPPAWDHYQEIPDFVPSVAEELAECIPQRSEASECARLDKAMQVPCKERVHRSAH